MKGKKLGLVGRCLLVGGLVVGGCGGLNPAQEQTLYNLTGLGYDYTMQQERNQAIREAGSEGGRNIGEKRRYDDINSPKKVARRRKIMMEDQRRRDEINSPRNIELRRQALELSEQLEGVTDMEKRLEICRKHNEKYGYD